MKFGLLLLALVALFWVGQPTGRDASAQSVDYVRLYLEAPGPLQDSDIGRVTAVGGEPRHIFTSTNTVSVEVPSQVVPFLLFTGRFTARPVPQVQIVEDDLPWGVDRIDAERVWGGSENAVNVAPGANTGAGITVAVVDTGIASHIDLNIVGGASMISGVSSYNDGNGHGTHVAGTVAARDNNTGVLGVAPGASLLAVKVLSDTGSGWMDDVAAGIYWAADNGADVINMSLSCYDPNNNTSSSSCNDPDMNAAMQYAANRDVVIVAAAGNSGSGTNTVGWPAQSPLAIAVAATTSTDARASFSSTGPAVEIAAPGQDIYSTYPGGYTTMSGTSMASPHVAGAAALLRACGYDAGTIRSMLTDNAIDLGSSGRDNSFGYGLLYVDPIADCEGGSAPPLPPPETGSVMASEDFESSNWSGGSGWSSNWTAVQEAENYGSDGPQSGSRHARIRNDGQITRTFNLSGYSSATLNFWAKASSWENSWWGGNDGASVLISTNGSSWSTLASYSDGFDTGNYQQQTFNISSWAGQPTVYLRFLGQMSSTSDYWYIDTIEVTGVSSGPTATPTATSTPTSTSTPAPTATHTNTPLPTSTSTNTPVPTSTNTPAPTATSTNTPVPPTATSTNTPAPPTPTSTSTPVPPTATSTNTPAPLQPTATPTVTNTPAPSRPWWCSFWPTGPDC